MRSKRPSRPLVQSPSRISARSVRPQASILLRATFAAAAETSTPTPRAWTNSLSKAHMSAPEPTPRSRIRNGSSRRSLSSLRDVSTIVSVSGRGSNTCGEIVSVRPQNSRFPTILDSGSPAARRAANSSTFRAADPSGSCGATINASGETPDAAERVIPASRFGSSIPQASKVSTRQASASARRVEARRAAPIVKRPSRGSV